jgi:MYXO-CTERM domain-containing protein
MSRPALARASAPLALATLFVSGSARATYSVVATDQATRQVGGATTSCVGAQSVATVYGPSPGHGGINAQAAQNIAGRDRGVMLLSMDTAPADIITQITAPTFDPNARTRQYGIADLSGRAAGFTGMGAQEYKEDRQGTIGTYTYSAQGNILTSKAVLDQAETAFRTRGCDLAEKLMLALEAGAMNGEGDSRCTPRGVPSDSASIEVDLATGAAGSYLRLSLSGTGNTSPLIRLRSMFDTWRMTHPCATGDGGILDAGGPRDASNDTGSRVDARVADATSDARDAGSAGGAGTGGSGGAGGSTTGGAGGTGGSGAGGSGSSTGGASGSATTSGSGVTSGTGSGGTTGAGGGTGTSTAASTAGGAGGSAGAGGGEDAGCSCRTGRRSAEGIGAWMALAAALAALGRRKQRDRS